MLLILAMLISQAPTLRTLKAHVVEERPLSICQLSVQASTIVHGRVVSIGDTVQLREAATGREGLFTPIQFQMLETLFGSAPTQMTIYVQGEVFDGKSYNRSIFTRPGAQVDGVAFVVEHGGVSFVHAGGGWFWEQGGKYSNPFSPPVSLVALRQSVAVALAGNGGCSKVVFTPLPPNPSPPGGISSGDAGVK